MYIYSSVLCLLRVIVLNFENEELKYHQKRAFAIGNKFAPPYSNLFMVGLEKRIFQNNKFKPFLQLQYIDEIFCIWTQDPQKVNELVNCINSLHPTIKFTMDYSTTEINFLGVALTKVGNKLERDLFCEPNDTQQYLHTKLCNRNVYKRSIGYRQVVRFKT